MSKIKRIEIKNWIGITELALDAGKINKLSGRKGSGKTSVVEALEKAFTNRHRRAEVVRHGEKEATIYIQTDDGLEISRKIRANKKSDYLRIKKLGEAVPQTEAFLRKLVNGDIFRPLEFIKKTPAEQANIILDMLEIEWTLDDINKWFGEIPSSINYEVHVLKVLKQIEQLYYDERETLNREIKAAEARVTGIKNDLPPNYDGEYWKQQKVQEYYNKVAESEENNKKIAGAKNLIDNLETRIKALRAESESDKEIKKNQLNRKRAEIKDYRQFLLSKIEKTEGKIALADDRIRQTEKDLDAELQAEIQKLKEEYAQKKTEVRERIDAEAKELENIVSSCKESIAVKEQELANMDKLEEQALQAVGEKLEEKIKTENAKAGNARTILKTLKEIDVEPLRDEADKVADMQSYLREWERMNDIINGFLSPRQEKSKTLTAKIAKARELPRELLKTAAVPIPGILVDGEGHIRIGKTLISDLSEGEQLELAFRVAKAQAGELKVICLDGINKINEADRMWIEKDAKKDDFQYFLLETSDSEQMQIEIGGD